MLNDDIDGIDAREAFDMLNPAHPPADDAHRSAKGFADRVCEILKFAESGVVYHVHGRERTHQQIVEIVQAVSPRYPVDSFGILEMANAAHEYRIPRLDDFQILSRILDASCIPQYCDRPRWTWGRGGWEAQLSSRFSSTLWSIEFSGTDYPVEVELTRFSDMDLISSHSDECDDDARETGSCCCEAQEEHYVKRVFTRNETPDEIDDAVAYIAKWLMEQTFIGQPEEE